MDFPFNNLRSKSIQNISASTSTSRGQWEWVILHFIPNFETKKGHEWLFFCCRWFFSHKHTHTHTHKCQSRNIASTFWSVMFEKLLPAWQRAAAIPQPLSLSVFCLSATVPLHLSAALASPATDPGGSSLEQWWTQVVRESVYMAETRALSWGSCSGLEGLSSPHRSALSCFWSCVN